MSNKHMTDHVIELLDSVPFSSLSETELARIREHSEHCSACRRAFSAAQLSALIIRERAAAAIEPSPFFQTRVMAALREKQNAAGGYSFARLWKSAQALVYSLAAFVVLLGALTVFQPGFLAAGEKTDDPEWTVLADGGGNDDMSYDQVLSDIYDEREDADGNRQ
ncbi:MAG: hypothetical protein J2P41_12335 [Blastocatellia bacterium]|nr:hypothetical protein [Blastocatellia bacterium]